MRIIPSSLEVGDVVKIKAHVSPRWAADQVGVITGTEKILGYNEFVITFADGQRLCFSSYEFNKL